jgi:hypothetical protein
VVRELKAAGVTQHDRINGECQRTIVSIGEGSANLETAGCQIEGEQVPID